MNIIFLWQPAGIMLAIMLAIMLDRCSLIINLILSLITVYLSYIVLFSQTDLLHNEGH